MRFMSIFWLLNGSILLAIGLFAFASIFLFGREYAVFYWERMWLFAGSFVIMVGGFDFFFIRNWRLFDLMEKENWPALLACLEDYIYSRGKLTRRYANLLINTALSVSNFSSVKKLEIEVRHKKPELLCDLGVSLGIPLILEQNNQAIAEYFRPFVNNAGIRRSDIAKLCYANAIGTQGDKELVELLNTKDLAVRLLALDSIEKTRSNFDEETRALIDEARNTIRAAVAGSKGIRALQHSRENHLMAMVLSRRIDAARENLL